MLAPLLLSLATLLPADAGPRRACAPLKPEQRLSQDQRLAVDAALRGSLGAGELSSERRVERRLLSEDALARSWFVYQACVMRGNGLIDEHTAQALVRGLMGVAGPPGEAPPADDAAAPTPPHTSHGTIHVAGLPSRANVWLNGAPKGQLGSGMTMPVPPGTHKVTLTLKGYRPVRATLDVRPGETEQVSVAGLSPRTSPLVWLGVGMATAGFVGTGALIGGIALQTL
jgi:hypothetical protein